MDSETEARMLKNWRGRRLLACRAMDQIERIIAHLGVEDGSELPPTDREVPSLSPVVQQEVQNSASVLLRMILALNDGGCSPQKLPRY